MSSLSRLLGFVLISGSIHFFHSTNELVSDCPLISSVREAHQNATRAMVLLCAMCTTHAARFVYAMNAMVLGHYAISSLRSKLLPDTQKTCVHM